MKTEWKTVVLGELVEILSGFAFDSEKFGDSGDIPIVRIRDVIPGKSSTFYRGEFDPRFIISDGDVLIGMDGEFNCARWQGGDALLNQRVCRLSPSNGRLDAGYMFHFLPAALKAIERVTPFVTVKHLSVKHIREIEIPLPPLTEQRRIAEVLDQAKALRAKRRSALAQLDTLIQSVFLDLFGDPATNPKHFPISTFAEACERIFKGAFDLKASSYRADGIPFIRIANIQGNTIDLTDAVYLDERTHKYYQGSELLSGDLVFSKVGTIDRIAVIPNSIPRCNISQNNAGAKLRKTIALPVYALAFLTTPYALGKIRAGSKKAVQDKLVLEELRTLPFMLPPLGLQFEFAHRMGAAEKLKTAQRASLAELDALFAALQHRAFRGEL